MSDRCVYKGEDRINKKSSIQASQADLSLVKPILPYDTLLKNNKHLENLLLKSKGIVNKKEKVVPYFSQTTR